MSHHLGTNFDIFASSVEKIVETKTELVGETFIRFYKVVWKSQWVTEALLQRFCGQLISEFWKSKGNSTDENQFATSREAPVTNIYNLPLLSQVNHATMHLPFTQDILQEATRSIGLPPFTAHGHSPHSAPLPSLFSPNKFFPTTEPLKSNISSTPEIDFFSKTTANLNIAFPQVIPSSKVVSAHVSTQLQKPNETTSLKTSEKKISTVSFIATVSAPSVLKAPASAVITNSAEVDPDTYLRKSSTSIIKSDTAISPKSKSSLSNETTTSEVKETDLTSIPSKASLPPVEVVANIAPVTSSPSLSIGADVSDLAKVLKTNPDPNIREGTNEENKELEKKVTKTAPGASADVNMEMPPLRLSGDHNYVAKSEVNNQPESAVIKVKHVVLPMRPQTFMTLSCRVVRKGLIMKKHNPGVVYSCKVNSGNTRTLCEICSKLKTKTPERRHWQISHNVLVFPPLTFKQEGKCGKDQCIQTDEKLVSFVQTAATNDMPIVDLASTPKTAEKSRKSKSIELNDKKVIQKNTESTKKAVQKTMEPPKKVIQKGTEQTKKAVHTNKRKNPAPKKKPPLKIPAKSKSKENVSTSKSFSLSSPKSKKVEGSMKRTLRRPSRLSKLNAELKTELLADEESEEITDQSDEEGQNDVYVEEFSSSEEEIAEHNSDDEEYDPANETVDEKDFVINSSSEPQNKRKRSAPRKKISKESKPPKQEKTYRKMIGPPMKCPDCGKEYMKEFCPRCAKKKTCEVCGHKYVTKCTSCAYKCHICGKVCWKSYRLKQHIETIHEKIKKYKCEKCGLLFVAKSRLIRHRDVHKEAPDLICNVCGKAFRHRTTFYRHRKIHSGIKEHKCPICGREFQQKEAMKTHLRIHSTGPKRFKCLLCAKDFNHKVSLKEHMQKHHNKDEQQAAVMIGLWKKYQQEEGNKVEEVNHDALLTRALTAVAMKPNDGPPQGVVHPTQSIFQPALTTTPHQVNQQQGQVTFIDFPYIDFANHELQIPLNFGR